MEGFEERERHLLVPPPGGVVQGLLSRRVDDVQNRPRLDELVGRVHVPALARVHQRGHAEDALLLHQRSVLEQHRDEVGISAGAGAA